MMREELEKELVKLAPFLYGEKSMQNTFRGFECDDGWFKLIKELSIKLEAEIMKLPEVDRPEYTAFVCKEKFGRLTFQFNGATEEMYKITREFENKSNKICEVCGQPGKTYPTTWVKTVCEAHKGS